MNQEAFWQCICWDFLGCPVQCQKFGSMIFMSLFQHMTFHDKIIAWQIICVREVLRTRRIEWNKVGLEQSLVILNKAKKKQVVSLGSLGTNIAAEVPNFCLCWHRQLGQQQKQNFQILVTTHHVRTVCSLCFPLTKDILTPLLTFLLLPRSLLPKMAFEMLVTLKKAFF